MDKVYRTGLGFESPDSLGFESPDSQIPSAVLYRPDTANQGG